MTRGKRSGGGVAIGFAVDGVALAAAARGIRGTVEQVAVGGVALIGGLAGHDGLARALDGFVERSRRGVGALVEDGRAMADQLDADSRAYAAVDEAGRAGLGGVLEGGGPDPAAG